jgi:FtsP/CotA-like multicopper oxidase with cupredoxin domain
MRRKLSGHRTRLAVAGLIGLVALFGMAGSSVGLLAHVAARKTACAKHWPTVIRDGFPEPPMWFSRRGNLNVNLTASVSPVTIAGHRQVTMNYNGYWPAPVMVFCPGDNVVVHFHNKLSEVTNLHVHGLHVSPRANHDNIFLTIHPGERFKYQYSVPLDQHPGFFWYHAHHHEFVDRQETAGLVGSIVVQGALDDKLAGIPQRIIVIQGTQLCDATGHTINYKGGATTTCSPAGHTVPVDKQNPKYTPQEVNGTIEPVAHIRPGQIQRWRILNANADTFLRLSLAGQTVQEIAEDGETLRFLRPVRELLIPPGSRREILVTGARPGKYVLRALPFAQFIGQKEFTNIPVLTLDSGGKRVKMRLPRGPFFNPVDLRKQRVNRVRRIVFSEVVKPKLTFLINHHEFDPNYVPITMKLNSVEQWKLVNVSTEWHTFHIHQNPFQVLSVAGRRLNYIDYEDNVGLPPKSTVVIRMQPINFTGKFVFHCHVVFHEDNGMMMAVRVVRSLTRSEGAASTGAVHGIAVSSSAYGKRALPALPRSILLFCHLLGVRAATGALWK